MSIDLKMVQEFEDFLNMPPRTWDIEPMEVRDYRHEAYRKWEPLCRAIMALLKAAPRVEIIESRQWSSATFSGWSVTARGTALDENSEPNMCGLLLVDAVTLANGDQELLLVNEDRDRPVDHDGLTAALQSLATTPDHRDDGEPE